MLFSASAEQSYLDAGFRPGDALIFGRESVGLPDELLDAHRESVFGIPTLGAVRQVTPPFELSVTPASVRTPPPLLGEQSDEILAEVGYTAAELTALHEAGVV